MDFDSLPNEEEKLPSFDDMPNEKLPMFDDMGAEKEIKSTGWGAAARGFLSPFVPSSEGALEHRPISSIFFGPSKDYKGEPTYGARFEEWLLRNIGTGEGLGQKGPFGPEQKAADEALHPYAQQLGGLARQLPLLAPTSVASALAPNLLARGVGATAFGGGQAIGELASGEPDWGRVGIAAAAGAALPGMPAGRSPRGPVEPPPQLRLPAPPGAPPEPLPPSRGLPPPGTRTTGPNPGVVEGRPYTEEPPRGTDVARTAPEPRGNFNQAETPDQFNMGTALREGEVTPPPRELRKSTPYDDDVLFATQQRDTYPEGDPLREFWDTHISDLKREQEGRWGPEIEGDYHVLTTEDLTRANDITTVAKGVAADNPPAPKIPGAGNPVGAPMAAREPARPTDPIRDYRKLPAPVDQERGGTTSGQFHPDVMEAMKAEHPPAEPPGGREIAPPAQEPQPTPSPQQRPIVQYSARATPPGGQEIVPPTRPIGDQPTAIANLRAIHDRSKVGGVSGVSIHDLIQQSGLPKEQVHQLLTEAAKTGEVTLHASALAPDQVAKPVREAGIPTEDPHSPLVTAIFDRAPPKREPRILPDLSQEPAPVTAPVTPEQRASIEGLREDIRKNMPDHLEVFDALPIEKQVSMAEEHGQVFAAKKKAEYDVEKRPTTELGKSTRGKADEARKTGATVAAREAFRAFQRPEGELEIPTSKKDIAKLVERLQNIRDKSLELYKTEEGKFHVDNEGKAQPDPLHYIQRAHDKPASSSLLLHIRKLTETGKGKGPTSANIRDFRKVELEAAQELKDNAPISKGAKELQKTRAIEAGIEKRPGAEPDLEAAGETRERTFHEPPSGLDRESKVYRGQHAALRKVLNGLTDKQWHTLNDMNEGQLAHMVKATNDPKALGLQLVKDLKEAQKKPDNEKPISPPSVDAMRNAGLTDYEIRQMEKNPDPTKARQINEGYSFISGEWRKTTAADVESAQRSIQLADKRYIKDKSRLDEMFAKADYPPVSQVLGSDWGVHSPGGSPESFKTAAYRTLDRNLASVKRMAAKTEQAYSLGNNEKSLLRKVWENEQGSIDLSKISDWWEDHKPTMLRPRGDKAAMDYGDQIGMKGILMHNNITKDMYDTHANALASAAEDIKPAQKGDLWRAAEQQNLASQPKEAKEYWDKFVKPIRDKATLKYEILREIYIRNQWPGYEKMPEVKENPGGTAFMPHRSLRGKSEGTKFEPTTNRTGGVSTWAEAAQERDWFVAWNQKTGERKVYHVNSDGNMIGYKDRVATGRIPAPKGFDPRDIGGTIKGKSGDWTVEHATVDELNKHAVDFDEKTKKPIPMQLSTNPLWAISESYIGISAALTRAKLLDAVLHDPKFAKLSVFKQGEANDKFGRGNWSESVIPQLKGRFMPKPVVWAFNDLAGTNYKGESSVIKAIERVNQAIMKPFYAFGMEVHPMNVLDQFLVGRGLAKNLNLKAGYDDLRKGITSVRRQDDIAVKVMDAGGNPMHMHSFVSRVSADIAKAVGEDMAVRKWKYDPLLKAYGVNSREAMAHLYHKTQNGMWFQSDALYYASIHEQLAKGKTMEQAVKETEKHVPAYTVPSTFGNSMGLRGTDLGRITQQVLTNPAVAMFGRYTFDILKQTGAIVKGGLGPNSTKEERLRALSQALMLPVMYGVYKLLSKGYQQVTGNEHSEFESRGQTRFASTPYDIYKGDRTPEAIARRLFTPSPLLDTAKGLLFNQDYAGRKTRDTAGHLTDYLAGQTFTPYRAFSQGKQEQGSTLRGVGKFLESNLSLKTPSQQEVMSKMKRNAPHAPQKSRGVLDFTGR